MIAYLNGRLCSLEDAKVSVLDRGFLFGDGVYEVVRCYGGHWFRMKDHADRLARSLQEVGLESFDADWMEGIAADLVTANGPVSGEAILYLQITRGCDTIRSHVYPDPPLRPTVFGMLRHRPRSEPEPPASVVTVEDRRWGRCDIKTISLLGHTMAANTANTQDSQEAILVRDGFVTEGSCTNVAIVRGGTVITHPESPSILSGISRKVVLELCADLGVPVLEQAFRADELGRADEVFLMGTTHEIWPVARVNGELVSCPEGKDSVTQLLRSRFSELARSVGRAE